MQSSLEEIGIITAFIENLEKHTIPRALAIKKRVFEGESLNEIDTLYFEEQLSEASSVMHLLQHHPEYQKLAVEMASLYHDITEQALKNELNK